MKILKQEKNVLLDREEFFLELESKTNPSFDEVKKALGKDEELTVVKGIKGGFGNQVFNSEVFVYGSKESKKKIEPKVKSKKGSDGEQPADAPAPAEVPKEETPKEEEKKEETLKEDVKDDKPVKEDKVENKE